MLVSSQSKEKVPAMAAPGPLLETRIDISKQRVDGAITHEWHILKSIVYGGLIESILSLGLVSSAAGSDATTCMCFHRLSYYLFFFVFSFFFYLKQRVLSPFFVEISKAP